MRVPYSWLKEYVELHESANQVAEYLLSIGIPVENIEKEGPEVTGVLTGRIKEISQHPDADRLRVCNVDMGSNCLQIVTAATNVRVGQVVAVATHGALLASGTKIKKGKLRGVMSEGMFCGFAELGLDESELSPEQLVGILDLPQETPLGASVAELVHSNEDVFVLEAFANRPDQLSILGIARELAAKLGRELKMPEVCTAAGLAANPEKLIEIADSQACPRYVGRVVENVAVAPAPSWMRKRLEAAGLRSVNNVVDITNYVMLETGQPLHAFDMDRLSEQRIIVRRSQPGEHLTTLDGEERELPENCIVIADATKAVGVAGVMGGLNSEITDDTKRLVLESAAFNCRDIRRASLRLGLRTEASKRYEKGLDLQRTEFASARAGFLLGKFAGTVRGEVYELGELNVKPVTIKLRCARVAAVLGIELSSEQICRILQALEFGVEAQDAALLVTVPSHRQDILEEVDLIEEIARHYGYDNLPTTVPEASESSAVVYDDAGEEWLRDALTRLGLNEVLTPSLHGPDTLTKYCIEADPAVIMNPLSLDQKVLRPYLFPAMLAVIERNLCVRNRDLRLFEISRTYEKKGQDVAEIAKLCLGLSFEGADFFALKGLVERLAQLARVSVDFSAATKAWLHPGQAAQISCDGQVIGWLGALHPSLARDLGLEAPVFIAELDVEALASNQQWITYKPFSRFPSVERDLAFVVANEVTSGTIAKRMQQVGGQLVEKVFCFDVYRDEKLGAAVKSLAFRAILTPFEHTLTEEEISKVMGKMQKVIEREFNAKLRD